MEKVIIKNCVYKEEVVITTYPRWSDYGCLTNAVKIAWEEDGVYKNDTFVTEDLEDLVCYDVEIESWGDTVKYREYINSLESDQMKKDNFRIWLNLRDKKYSGIKVRVIKGKKYPKGFEFIATKAHEFEIPKTYGHGTVYYLDGENIHINVDNVEFVEVM